MRIHPDVTLARVKRQGGLAEDYFIVAAQGHSGIGVDF